MESVQRGHSQTRHTTLAVPVAPSPTSTSAPRSATLGPSPCGSSSQPFDPLLPLHDTTATEGLSYTSPPLPAEEHDISPLREARPSAARTSSLLSTSSARTMIVREEVGSVGSLGPGGPTWMQCSSIGESVSPSETLSPFASVLSSPPPSPPPPAVGTGTEKETHPVVADVQRQRDDATTAFPPSPSPQHSSDIVEGCYRYLLDLSTRTLKPLPLLTIPTHFRAAGSGDQHQAEGWDAEVAWHAAQTALPRVAPSERENQQRQWRQWQRLLSIGFDTTEGMEGEEEEVREGDPAGHQEEQARRRTVRQDRQGPRRGSSETRREGGGPVIPVECRWGLQVHQLDELVALHKVSFPIDYDLRYYEWFWSGPTISLVAYTTSEGLDQLESIALRRKQMAQRKSDAFIQLASGNATLFSGERSRCEPHTSSENKLNNRSEMMEEGTKKSKRAERSTTAGEKSTQSRHKDGGDAPTISSSVSGCSPSSLSFSSSASHPYASRAPRFPKPSFLFPWDSFSQGGHGGANQVGWMDPLSAATHETHSPSVFSSEHRRRRRTATTTDSETGTRAEAAVPLYQRGMNADSLGRPQGNAPIQKSAKPDHSAARVIPRYEVFDPLPMEKVEKYRKRQQQERESAAAVATLEPSEPRSGASASAPPDSSTTTTTRTADPPPSPPRHHHYHHRHVEGGMEHYSSLSNGCLRRRARQCSVMVGLVAGQPTYASVPALLFPSVQDDEEVFFVNPVQYIGAIAVSPLLRQCGVGGELLSLYTTCVYTQYPVRLRSFLHHRLQVLQEAPAHRGAKSKSVGWAEGKTAVRREEEEEEEEDGGGADSSTTTTSQVRFHLQDPSLVEDSWLQLSSGSAASGTREQQELGLYPRNNNKKKFGAPPTKPDDDTRGLAHTVQFPLSPASRTIAMACRPRNSERGSGFVPAAAEEAEEQRWRYGASVQGAENENPVVQYGYEGGIWLHCLASDTSLRQFYAKRGYKEICELPEYYEFDGATHTAALLCYRPHLPSPRTRTRTGADHAYGEGRGERAPGEQLVMALRQNARAASLSSQVPIWWVSTVAIPMIRNVGLVTTDEAQERLEQRLRASNVFLRDNEGSGSCVDVIRDFWARITGALSGRGSVQRESGTESKVKETNNTDRSPTRLLFFLGRIRSMRLFLYTGVFAVASLLLTVVTICYFSTSISVNQRKHF